MNNHELFLGLSFGTIILIALICGFVLFVLQILQPLFVYLMYRHQKKNHQELKTALINLAKCLPDKNINTKMIEYYLEQQSINNQEQQEHIKKLINLLDENVQLMTYYTDRFDELSKKERKDL